MQSDKLKNLSRNTDSLFAVRFHSAESATLTAMDTNTKVKVDLFTFNHGATVTTLFIDSMANVYALFADKRTAILVSKKAVE